MNKIDPEMIKWIREEGKGWLLEILKEAWKRSEIPKDLEENLMVPIHKKSFYFARFSSVDVNVRAIDLFYMIC